MVEPWTHSDSEQIVIESGNSRKDVPWRGETSKGELTSQMVYKLCNFEENARPCGDRFWGWKDPKDPLFFVVPCSWETPTRERLFRRNICTTDRCLICVDKAEIVLHTLGDCAAGVHVWKRLVEPTFLQDFYSSTEYEHWAANYLVKTWGRDIHHEEWKYYFREAAFSLWKRRNSIIF